MTLIENTIKKEKQRVEFMLAEYKKKLCLLPKGTICEKTSGSKQYYYLKYREGSKIISKYISAEDIIKVKDDISERKHVEEMIKELKKELKIANRAMGVTK